MRALLILLSGIAWSLWLCFIVAAVWAFRAGLDGYAMFCLFAAGSVGIGIVEARRTEQ